MKRLPEALRRRLHNAWRRWSLWALLAALLVVLLGTLVWLAGRYEMSQLQNRLESDAAAAVLDIRGALARNAQSLQALQPVPGRATPREAWEADAQALLRERREWVRIEWRDPALALLAHADTPYQPPLFERTGRDSAHSDIALACATARRFGGPAYAPSYFVAQPDGRGLEVMELCLPLMQARGPTGYLLATYSLQDMLVNLTSTPLRRSAELSFVEPDGTRLALHGNAPRGRRVFTAQQLLDLPGNSLMLRINSVRSAPDLFPNVLTALVTAMSIALVTVLVQLVRDNRRRLRAERGLADALAFRKAMEDSLVTGLRARDLQGRTTYVNPAFCQMVGFSAAELLSPRAPAPYWPPELAGDYAQRQAVRLAGHAPPREGFESVFMRKDGSRFPVLIIEAPLIDAQGVQTGWMSAVLDISEQRRVEELSRASQERLQATARLATVGEMASLLSHELNQPLAAISSYATGSMNLLRDGAPPAAELAMAIRRIAEQAERAGKVIRSVHDLVRRRDQAREAVAPQALLDAILPLVNLQARKLQVQVCIAVDDGLGTVWCERTMIEQVLLNLARNGMQAMDGIATGERVLWLGVRRAPASESRARTPDWLEFSVADAGRGIAPEVARQLFTPFFTTRDEGMGLGLSLCRTVVEQHGGHLGFEPHAPRGTIFRFTLPARPMTPAAATATD